VQICKYTCQLCVPRSGCPSLDTGQIQLLFFADNLVKFTSYPTYVCRL